MAENVIGQLLSEANFVIFAGGIFENRLYRKKIYNNVRDKLHPHSLKVGVDRKSA